MSLFVRPTVRVAKPVWRRIVKREFYRTSSHPNGAADSLIATLDCGHDRRYKGSKVPRTDRVRCDSCETGGVNS